MARLTFQEAERELKRVGYGPAKGDAGILATVRACTLAHPGLSEKLLYEGAVKMDKSDKDLRDMLKRGYKELDDLMWA